MRSAGVIDVAERNPATATVKIDPELLRKAKVLCAMKGTKVSDFLDRLIRAAIEKEYGKVIPEQEESE
jgi:hypothetical protein